MGFAPLWWPLSVSRPLRPVREPNQVERQTGTAGPAMPAHALLPAVNRVLHRVNLNEKREAQLVKDSYRVLLSK